MFALFVVSMKSGRLCVVDTVHQIALSFVKVLGGSLIGLGLWFLFSYNNSELNMSYMLHNIRFIPTSLIVVGTIILLISFVGCWGALKENTFMLKFYAWILLFILFFKMWGAIFIAISSYRERAHATNVSEFKNMFDQYGSNNGDTLLVNAIQSSFQCCGYEKSETMEFVNGTYPWSCCGSPEDVCVHPLFTDNCVQRVSEVLSPILLTISIVYYTMVVVQILCIVIAFCLSSSISKKLAAKPLYYNL